MSLLVEFGLYSTMIAAGAICIGIFGFGAPTRALRIRGENYQEELAAALVLWTLIAGSCISLVLILLATLLNRTIEAWALAAISFTFSELVSNLNQNLLFGEGKDKKAEAIMLTRRLIPFLIILGSIALDFDQIFLAAAIGYALSMLSSLILLGRRRWHGFYFHSTIVESYNYWQAGLWSMLQQIDVILINAFLGSNSAGAYSAAFRLASPIHIVTSSLTALMVPQLSSNEDLVSRLSIGRKYVRWGVLYATSIVILAPIAAYLAPTVLGEEFNNYYWVIVILLWNSALSVVNQLNSGRVYAEGLASAVAKHTRISTISGLTLVASAAGFGSLLLAALATCLIQIILFTRLQSTINGFRRTAP